MSLWEATVEFSLPSEVVNATMLNSERQELPPLPAIVCLFV